MHYMGNSAFSYDFACDGKPHPTLADRTITCTGTPEAGYDYTSMAGTAVLSKSHRTFSADNKMMTIKGTSMNADGSKMDYEETYKRLTGTKGLVGKWLDIKTSGVPGMFKYTVADDKITYEDPMSKVVFTCSLNGLFAPVTGPISRKARWAPTRRKAR